jgi:hypothetical protein
MKTDRVGKHYSASFKEDFRSKQLYYYPVCTKKLEISTDIVNEGFILVASIWFVALRRRKYNITGSRIHFASLSRNGI